MNLWQRAVDEGNVLRAWELLAAHRPRRGEKDLRGFEWRWLWGRCRDDSRITFQEGGLLRAVAVSPDGRLLAVGGSSRTTRLLDLASGREVAALEGQPDWINDICFSPDGKVLATGGGDSVLLWDMANRQNPRRLAFLRGHFGTMAIAFSPDSQLLATA